MVTSGSMTHDPASSADFGTLVDLLAWRGQNQPDRRAFAFLGDGEHESASLTYGELHSQVRAVADALIARGARGERALLLYPPGLEFISAFLGCLSAGVVAVPAYPPDPSQLTRTLTRLQAIAADSEPRFALTLADVRDQIRPFAAMDPRFGAVEWIASDALPEITAASPHPAPSPEDVAFLQYTSGSTSEPRGVMVTHANIMDNEGLVRAVFQQDAASVVVGWLPVYHDMGLIGNVLHPLYLGARCVLMSPIAFLQKPVRWLHAIAHYGGTISGGPNFAYDLCVRKTTDEDRRGLDLSRWNLAFNGAEPVRADTVDRFAAAFAVSGFRAEAMRPCYGLAEATLIAASAPKLTTARRRLVRASSLERHQVEILQETDVVPDSRSLVSSGGALAGQALAVIDPETRSEAPAGTVGEIWLAGPSVAAGYWRREEETSLTFGARRADRPDRAWLRTGDLGFLHEGELHVTGRLKDLIILEGRNIYPQDVERAAEIAHSRMRPGCSAAFSVELQDREKLVVMAEVDERLSPGQETLPDFADIAREVRAAVTRELSVAVHKVVLIRAGKIPKTSSGKIQRHACKARFQEGSLEPLASA